MLKKSNRRVREKKCTNKRRKQLKQLKQPKRTKPIHKKSNTTTSYKRWKKKLDQCTEQNAIFLSDNGMQPTVFGPIVWHFLHMISFNYPIRPTKEQKAQYTRYIWSLSDILPCQTCRHHMKQNLIDLGFDRNNDEIMSSRSTFSKFIFDLHNRVNEQLQKKPFKSFKRVKTKYEMYRYRKHSPYEKRYHISLRSKVLCK